MSATPWWQALKIRPEIIDASGQIDDVQMSLFRAIYSAPADRPAYANATYYGEITHPTDRLVSLLAEVAVRLGGATDHLKARSVTRLDQGMGGGKSHACIGAYHLAASAPEFRTSDLGQQVWAEARRILGRDLPDDLDQPLAVVLPCDNMTPGAPVREHDGPATNLYERFLWRLFSKDYALFERYQPYFNDKSKIVDALRAVDRPVLIIIDEIMDYVGNGLDGAGKPDLAAQDMGFLRALFDAVNDVPRVSLLIVMIASDRMALSSEGERRRDELNDLLVRNGKPATVTEAGDFAAILRRRLFDQIPPNEVLSAVGEQFSSTLRDKNWARQVWDAQNASWRDRWDDELNRCYPFHPMLIALAQDEWSKVTGFQRVRSTIRIFAAAVFALQQRGRAGEWVPALIGPGDLPLSDNNVREAILGSGLVDDERTISNYRSMAEIEIVNNGGTSGIARRQDLDRDPLLSWTPENPRAAERAATFLFLTSIVGALRPGRGRGASAPELKAATSVPDPSFTVTDADAVIEELMTPDRGLAAVEVIPGQGNNKPTRYYLSTRLTHRMLVSNIRRTITDAERDVAIAEFAERLANSGPFRNLRFVKADSTRTPTQVLATAGLDDARTTRLVVLDAAQFSLRNGMEDETLAALNVALGLGSGNDRIPVEWASSAVYAVVNTQRRALARGLAVEYLARQKALQTPEVQADPDLKSTGTRELAEAKDRFERAVRRAYQHVVYLTQPDITIARSLETVTFEDDNQTSLDGTQVWKALVEREKAFDTGQFNARALEHNLRDVDYGRPLSEIRDAFFNAPRLPLLHGGERDLQRAIYESVEAGRIAVVDPAGETVAVTEAGQVNLASTGLRLSKVVVAVRPEESAGAGDAEPRDYPETVGSQRRIAEDEVLATAPVVEKFVTFPLVGNLLASAESSEALARLFLTLYQALDENRVSYAAGTLQFVLQADSAEKIAEIAQSLALNVSIRDQ